MRAVIPARTLESPRDRSLLPHHRTDPIIAPSVQALIRSLRCTPEPRWWYDDTKHAHRVRYRPFDSGLNLIVGAIRQARREGHELPREDAHAPLRAMAALVDAELGRQLPPLPSLVREVAHAEGPAREAELALMRPDPSRVELERALERVTAERRYLEELEEALAQALDRVRKIA